jgi:hypothetical protein
MIINDVSKFVNKRFIFSLTIIELTTCFHEFSEYESINLFVTSKNKFLNSPNHEFKVLQNVFKIKIQDLRFFKVINKN